ncbi:MAG TPA: hypothetical protein ENK03_02870 [Candidatus Cloacimonetes bacterium]|nr:hypothetical protein [Candidatus Cloacimonadota bacterium]
MKLIIFSLIILLFVFSSLVHSEQLTIVCNNFSPEDSIQLINKQLTDSLMQKYNNFFVVSPFPFSEQNEQQICFFNPSIFSGKSLNSTQKVLSSNIQSTDSLFYDLVPYKPVILDTHSVVFISITTPDFPRLYKKYSNELTVQIDIFDRANELFAVFKKFGIDYVIAINYLGDYLSCEMLKKAPQLDLVIDYFSLDNTHHYMKEITHPRLINWSRKKEHLLLIEIELRNSILKVQNINLIE